MRTKLLKLVSLALAITLIVAISGTSAQPRAYAQDRVFKLWYYEPADSAMGIAWQNAVEQFKVMHPDVTVEFEEKVFEQIQETGMMILNSDEVPDVMEINKGNATAGLYASSGLLTDLSQVAEERGWLDILSPSILTTCRYNENGIMGSGNLYGVTTYGEFVMVYYNKDMFEEYGIAVPTTFEEFEAVADAFVEAGIVPLTLGAGDIWPATHNFYELVLYKADRDLISNFQFLTGDVDFHGEAFTFGAEKLAEEVEKGYYGDSSTGVIYADSNAAFVQGIPPMNLTGSWAFGGFISQITDFDWGIFIMPGKQFNTGSGGNLWVVPENAKNKDLAYDFIDLTLGTESQTLMANAGGIPINADLTQIEDPKILELNAAFASIVENDGIAFYPDWPVPGFMDVLGGGLQELIDGNLSPEEFLDSLDEAYNDYKSSLE
ncbi:MAG TPA: extracellular solute-binding protein [Aggregatilineaceae bacterium]|nr:extracellular solute-binding protein [Aggregatilineaceae bacterium]